MREELEPVETDTIFASIRNNGSGKANGIDLDEIWFCFFPKLNTLLIDAQPLRLMEAEDLVIPILLICYGFLLHEPLPMRAKREMKGRFAEVLSIELADPVLVREVESLFERKGEEGRA